MIMLLIVAKWTGLSVSALALGWTVGGHLDLLSLAGALGLIIWQLAALLIDSGRWGAGLPAGESGTTPVDSVELAVAMFSPALYVVAAGYAVVGLALVWLAISLAPWGLLILIPAVGVLAAAALLTAVAFGISRLEADPA